MELPYYVEYIQYGLTIVSILVLFLFAVESLTKEIQELATENFRKKISKLVKNRCSATKLFAEHCFLVTFVEETIQYGY